MVLRGWRFVTLLLAALDMGMAFAHTLELPAKMQYSASFYSTVQHTLYWEFGNWPGILAEMGAILSSAVLIFLVRHRRPALQLTLLGFGLLAIAFFLIWLVFVAPMNVETGRWTLNSIPPDWTRVRNQWEYAHATRFVLQLIGFCALLLSIVLETPSQLSQQVRHFRHDRQPHGLPDA